MHHCAYTGPGRGGAQEGGTGPVAGKAQKQEGSTGSKAALGLSGQWDGERSCRMLGMSHWQDREESQRQDSRGLSPCQVPVSLHHMQKGPHWVHASSTLCRRSFISCQGLQWSARAWPGLPSTSYLGQCHCPRQASLHRSAGSSGGAAATVLQSSSLASSLPVWDHQDGAASVPVFSLWNYG